MSSTFKAPNGRLREDGAIHIHELVESGMTYQKVAEVMGVAVATVYNIRTGRTWKFILDARVAAKAAEVTP